MRRVATEVLLAALLCVAYCSAGNPAELAAEEGFAPVDGELSEVAQMEAQADALVSSEAGARAAPAKVDPVEVASKLKACKAALPGLVTAAEAVVEKGATCKDSLTGVIATGKLASAEADAATAGQSTAMTQLQEAFAAEKRGNDVLTRERAQHAAATRACVRAKDNAKAEGDAAVARYTVKVTTLQSTKQTSLLDAMTKARGEANAVVLSDEKQVATARTAATAAIQAAKDAAAAEVKAAQDETAALSKDRASAVIAKGQADLAAAIEGTKAFRDKAFEARLAGVATASQAAFKAKENAMKLKVRLNAAAITFQSASKAAKALDDRNAKYRGEVVKQLAVLTAKFEAMQQKA